MEGTWKFSPMPEALPSMVQPSLNLASSNHASQPWPDVFALDYQGCSTTVGGNLSALLQYAKFTFGLYAKKQKSMMGRFSNG